MIAEDISACDWGQSRLTVAPNAARMTTRSHKNNLSGKNSTESRSCSSQGCTSRKSKMGFTTNCQYQNIRCTNCVFTGKLQAPRSDRILPSTTSTNHRTSFFNMHRVSQIVLFSLLTLCSWTSATFTDKGPLVETDATKRDDFRYFMSDIGASEMVMSRSSVAASLEDPVDSLGFQTLKVLDKWGNDTRDILLVAGKDHVYMLDSTLTHDQPEISYMERLTWRTHTDAKNECKMLPGQQPELCENFIRFVELMDNGELMVCGTNAYSPACRFYKREQFSDKGSDENSNYARENKCRGQCFVPYNPLTASAALSVDTENGRQIFMAVVNDFRSNEPKIMRQDKPTLLSNSLWLNDPTFLKILEYKDKVYVFFREVAKESESERGGDEQVTFARVAQVCKDDPGGVNILAQQWTSFLKARLRCGYPTRQYLQFNNLTSVTDIVNITDESGEIMDVVFATFTTPWEWQDASLSAVCAFSMKDIIKVFEEGSFSGEYELNAQPDVRSAYPRATPTPVPGVKTIKRSYPIPKDKEPVPRPGGCLKTYTPNVLFFAKEHPLMYDVIEPYGSAPLFVSNNNLRATQVAADTNAGESEKLMIYIGTEEGNVLRLRGMLASGDNPKAMLIESVKVSDEKRCEQNGCGVRSLHVSRPPVDHTNSKPSAFVAFTDYMVQFPLVRCSIFKSKECCSIDPDCGWDGNEQCVQRTAGNSASLIPTSKDTDKIPEACNAIDRTPTDLDCNCEGNNRHPPCHKERRREKLQVDDSLTLGSDILDIARTGNDPVVPPVAPLVMDLESILTDSILPAVERKFRETVGTLKDNAQREALKQQLEEALSSTAELVLKNHRQEYCLPSPTVNHLTHVYPLLLREIEVWHETALKKMSEMEFDKKCWGRGQSKCTNRVSFSIPLVPILWEPLKKLIVNFSGRCEVMAPARSELGAFRPEPSTRCSPLPGTESCKDSRQPHCYAKRCQFPKYSVDVKAFFRHANDSRQFLEHGDHIEPLWKPVNVTIPGGESVRGHLELAVSDHKPFVIDYSPVAEKVKIMFHYSAVRDCALTDPMCVGMAHGCNPEVENIVDHWFKYSFNKLSPKLRRCSREITKAKESENRERKKRQGRMDFGGHLEVADRSDWLLYEKRSNWNRVDVTPPDRCKYVGGKVRPLTHHPVTKNIWSLIVSRCQRSGGVYSAYHGSIEFYSLQDVLDFFKNICTFEKPTNQRKTFRKRAVKGRSRGSVIYLEPMVTPDTPFKIQRQPSGRVFIKYYTREG